MTIPFTNTQLKLLSQVSVGNNRHAKPLAKTKLFPLESLRNFIRFFNLYEICHPVTVS